MTNIFTDPRDKQVYRTVEIGNQIWLAENLRYRGPVQKFNDWTVENKNFYYPPGGKQKNISNMGCLYTWKNALKACPKGWRLPTKEELESLELGGWQSEKNVSGFSVMPVGSCYGGGPCVNFCKEACFWSSTPRNKHDVYSLCLTDSVDWITATDPNCCLSVRCVKGEQND